MRTNLPDGIWIIDAEGKTVFANEPMTEILGTAPAAIIGEDSFHFVFPEDLDAAQRLFSSKQAGDSASFHFRLRRKDEVPSGLMCKERPCTAQPASLLEL